jgi:hypothetical protein
MSRPWGLRLLGTLLIAYGVTGTVLLGVLAASIAAPLDEIGELAESVGEWRAAALEALDEASQASRETSATVRGMDASLVEAKGATDRAASLSAGMAQTMRDLSAAMALDIFGVQPLIGLAPGFDTSAQNLDLLSGDLADIGTALETTRQDAGSVATNVDDLAAAIEELRVAMADSPDMGDTLGARETLRLGLLALIGWLIAGSIGCIVGGLACWWMARRRPALAVRPIDRLEPLN